MEVKARLRARCYVSHEHRFVYIEMPKVACTSIKAALTPLFPETEEVDLSKRGAGHQAFKGTGQKYHYNKRQLLDLHREGELKGYFVFSFVRNPWDRLYSCWRSKIRKRRVLLDQTSYEGGELYPGMSFPEFANVVCATSDAEANLHFRSQVPLLQGPTGNYLTSFIGRFERLEEDFERVSKKLGSSLSLGHANASKGSSYEEAYNKELRNMVAERYRDDIEAFGYKFESHHKIHKAGKRFKFPFSLRFS